MAPKGKGGARQKTAQEPLVAMREKGLTEAEIRHRLREAGYKTGRISQLLRATRPVEADAATAGAEVESSARKRIAEKATEKRKKLLGNTPILFWR